MKTIAVLGCGPAGLMAAHAVGLCGLPMSIHSNPVKSRLGGAQYLHHPIPYLTRGEPDRVLTNRLQGDADGYRAKVYGLGSDSPTTVSAMNVTDGEQFGAWELHTAYDTLYANFESSVNAAVISPAWLEEHRNEFDMVISSIPAPALCKRPDIHRFTLQEVWILPGAPEFVPVDTVIYNGEKEPSWYRASNIGGVAGGVEWSTNGPKPPLPGLIKARKPLKTTCDCWPDVFRVGRYGQWRKGVLAHDAYYETGKMLMGVPYETAGQPVGSEYVSKNGDTPSPLPQHEQMTFSEMSEK